MQKIAIYLPVYSSFVKQRIPCQEARWILQKNTTNRRLKAENADKSINNNNDIKFADVVGEGQNTAMKTVESVFYTLNKVKLTFVRTDINKNNTKNSIHDTKR